MNNNQFMNKITVRIIILLVFSVFLAYDSFAETITVCASECNSTTIQGAIDLASQGDTVNVASGTYNENQISINKSISIIGAGKETTIIDGGNVTDLTDVGLVRLVTSQGDVVFTGFTIRAAGTSPLNLGISGIPLRVGIYVSSESSTSTFTISDNKILGTANPLDSEDYGLYGNAGNESLVFISNEITDTGANAILLERHTGPTDVSNNILNEGSFGASPYLSVTYGDSNIASLQKVSNNTINLNTGSNVGDDLTIAGITFIGAYRFGVGNGIYTNVRITDNTISNLQDFRRGISLENDASGDGTSGNINSPLISGNTITGNIGALETLGIQLLGLINNANISSNTLTDLDTAFNGTSGRNGLHYPIGSILNYNSFTNFNNFAWDGPTTLNAEHNWWGACDGPSVVIPVTVDFDPWLGACIIDKLALPSCVLGTDPVTLYANVSSLECIGDVLFGVNQDGVWTNHTAVLSSSIGNYSFPLGLVNGNQTVLWTVYADDCHGHVTQDGTESFYVNTLTSLSITPSLPDGNNGWFITEPLFALSNGDASTIFYRWDGIGPFVYTSPFGLDDIPNAPPKESAGILKLTYWAALCSTNETEQNTTLKVDLLSPLITDLTPSNNSLTMNNLKPMLSAYLDEVYHANSGVNKSTVLMKLDDEIVNATLTTVGSSNVNITYFPPDNLSVGPHNITVYAEDNSGRSSQLTWSFDVNIIEVFTMAVDSPEPGIYGSTKVGFKVSTSEEVRVIEFMNQDSTKPRWTVLCKDCDSYGLSSEKNQTLQEGPNNLTIKATDSFGNIREENISLFIDSKLPVVVSTLPKKNAVINGSLFSLVYTENNLANISLFVGNNSDVDTFPLNCVSGIKKECSTSVDLSRFDGQTIFYYFQVDDIVRSFSSKKTSIKVDTTPPLLTINSPTSGLFGRSIPFNISVSEPVRLQYFDLSLLNPRWTNLCTKCTEFGNSKAKTKSFGKGTHDLLIRGTDPAGQSDIKEVVFTVE